MERLTRTLSGQVVVAGEARGVALTTEEPLSMWGGLDPATGEIIDRHHPLAGERVAGRVLVLPHGRGSCSASGVLLEAIVNRTGPAAILNTRPDPIIGLGSILADELHGLRVPVVVISATEAAAIETGQMVAVWADGRVVIGERASPTEG